MSYVERHTVTVTTATGGGATGYTPDLTGRIVYMGYTKDTFASTTDLTITTELSTQAVWSETNINASKDLYPLAVADGVDGVALATAGDAQFVPVFVANERIKIVVAQGGNTAAGTFEVLVA